MSLGEGWSLVNGRVAIEQSGFVKIHFKRGTNTHHISLFYQRNGSLAKFNPPNWSLNAGRRVLYCDGVEMRGGEPAMCFVNFNTRFYLPHEDDPRRDKTKPAYAFVGVPAVVVKLPGFKGHVSLDRVDNAQTKRNFAEYSKNYKSWFGPPPASSMTSSLSRLSLASGSGRTMTVQNPYNGSTLLRRRADQERKWVDGLPPVNNGESVIVTGPSQNDFTPVEYRGSGGFIRTKYLVTRARASVGNAGYEF